MGTWRRPAWLFLLVLLVPVLQASAQDEAVIGELSYLDRQYMQQQRELLGELLARNYGARFSGQKERDLRLLQKILDDGLVRADQTQELQAMGVIMGDLLAAELGLHWVIYEDRLGRSRALRYRETDAYLFPMTMISRRREVDNRTPVQEIYSRAVDAIKPQLQPLPFQ